jgi:diguanylate cyclase (GGDEF)-like protein
MMAPAASGGGDISAESDEGGSVEEGAGAPGPEAWTSGAKRLAARVAAHALIDTVQDGPRPMPGAVAALVEMADRNQWPEVGVIARCALLLTEELATESDSDGGGGDPEEIVEVIRARAEAAGDPALIAVGHAFRAALAQRRGVREDRAITGAEPDLVVAVVLLERGVGGALERVFAHDTCGVAFAMMGLWELAIRQYEAAGAIAPAALEPGLADAPGLSVVGRAVAYHLVELHVDYACALWAVGEFDDATAEARAGLEHLGRVRATGADWSSSSLAMLDAYGLVARAIVGEDVAAVAAVAAADERELSVHRLLSAHGCYDPATTRRGSVALARALSLSRGGAPSAASVAEEAVSALQHSAPTLYRMALDVASRVEGAPAAARLAQAQTEKLWIGRRRSVDSMEAMIRAERLRSRSEELERHAHVDDLTGLANRRGFYRYLNDLLADRRSRVALLVVDIDRFKAINDQYGHPTGDKTLRRLAGVLNRLVRPLDLAARVGGDEFFLLFEGTGLQVAIERAETIVRAVAEPGPHAGDPALSVTIGVASGPPEEFDRLLTEADAALYRGKSTGGGRWVSSTATPASNPYHPGSGRRGSTRD